LMIARHTYEVINSAGANNTHGPPLC